MLGDSLSIRYDEADRAVWLVVDSPLLDQKELIWLRDGFSIQDVYEAIVATGWARPTPNGWRLTIDIRCQLLGSAVDEMLGYFKSSGDPTDELRLVQATVAQTMADRESTEGLSLFEYVWLDILVREDIADAARAVENPWSRDALQIDCSKYCERRVLELLARKANPSPVDFRLAPSRTSRPIAHSRQASTG